MTTFGAGYAAGFLVFGPLMYRMYRVGLRRMIVVELAATAAVTVAIAVTPTIG